MAPCLSICFLVTNTARSLTFTTLTPWHLITLFMLSSIVICLAWHTNASINLIKVHRMQTTQTSFLPLFGITHNQISAASGSCWQDLFGIFCSLTCCCTPTTAVARDPNTLHTYSSTERISCSYALIHNSVTHCSGIGPCAWWEYENGRGFS